MPEMSSSYHKILLIKLTYWYKARLNRKNGQTIWPVRFFILILHKQF